MFTLFFPVSRVVRDNRSWLVMAVLIFLFSAIISYQVGSAAEAAGDEALLPQLQQMEQLLELILTLNPYAGALLVFMNNFLALAQMLVLGVVLGLSPLFTLGLNGALTGTVLSIAAREGLPLVSVVLFGILPHGIFELSAFFLCGAIGLKFGYHCTAFPLEGRTRLQSYRHIWKEAISLLPLIFILLIVAAFIEMLATPRLLAHFLGMEIPL